MKRIVSLIMIISIVFCACGREENRETVSNSGSGAAVGNAVTESAVSGSTAGEKNGSEFSPDMTVTMGNKAEENAQYSEVVDETGESRLLKIGDIDVKDTGYEFQFLLFASDYSQVVDGHYYYLRTDGSNNYTVYRDKGEKVVCFAIDEGCFVENFVKYGEGFYAFLKEDEWALQGSDLYNTLIKIDEKTGEISKIKDMKEEIADHALYRASLYQDSLYYEDDEYGTESGRMAGILLGRQKKGKRFLLSAHMGDMGGEPQLTFIDGKAYYGLQQEKRVTLYSYDLENDEEKELLCYDRTDSKWRSVDDIKVDKDYIYCQNYIIPRAGGEMREFKLQSASSFSFNSRYIFYVDRKSRLHRVSRNLHKDTVVCDDIPIYMIDCTEDGIYIREYNKAWDEWYEAESWDYWGDPRSNNLYYMDCDGKNRKKLWNEIK